MGRLGIHMANAAALAASVAGGFFKYCQSVTLPQQGLFEQINLIPLLAYGIRQGFDLGALVGAEFFELLQSVIV